MKNVRQGIRSLEAKYPGGKNSVRIEPNSGYATEVASLRSNPNVSGDEGSRRARLPKMPWVLDVNRDKVSRERANLNDNRYHWRTNPDDYQEYQRRIIEGYSEKGEKAREVASYRQFEITSDILATPFALGAFQSIDLSADELPMMITPMSRQYFNVRYIGQDGGTKQVQWRGSNSALSLDINMLATDKIEYTLFDLQEGQLNEVSKVNAQLTYDMERKIENLALTSLESGQINSGLKDLLNIHPDVDLNNLPDENYIDLSGAAYGTNNKWNLVKLKAVLHQISRWGYGFSPDGPISIQTMIMSPQNANDHWDFVDLVSGFDSGAETWHNEGIGPGGQDNPSNIGPSGMRDQIMSSGSVVQSAWGMSWNTQFNTRMPVGRMYVLTNQPIGWYFTKSSFDAFISWDGQPDNIEQNYGQSMLRKAIMFYMPELWAYRFLIVDF